MYKSRGDPGTRQDVGPTSSEGWGTRQNLKKKVKVKRQDWHSSGLWGHFPWWLRGKESACQCRRHHSDPWTRKIPWRRKWQPTPVFLPGKSYGQRSLASYSPWDCKDLDTAEQLNHTHTHTQKKKTIFGVYVLRDHILYIHSSVHGHLSCFHIFPVVRNTIVNIHIEVLYKQD